MASHEDREKVLITAREALKHLSTINVESLARTEDLSRNINFSEAVPYFHNMLDVVVELNQRDLSRLPTPILQRVVDACKLLVNLINQVNEFNLNQNTPGDVCSSIITNIKNSYDRIVEPFILPLTFTATQSTDYSRIEREAKGHHDTIKKLAESFSSFLKESRKDAEEAMISLREQIAEAGIAENAEFYQQSSEDSKKAAHKWLLATSVIAGVTLLAAIGFFIASFKYTPSTTASAIQYVSGKVLILTVLFSALYWAARNYRAYKHNQLLNQHRKTSLLTFRTFVEGTADERVKDAVLLHAAQAAFGNRPTGFDSHEPEGAPVHPVVDVLGRIMRQPSGNE